MAWRQSGDAPAVFEGKDGSDSTRCRRSARLGQRRSPAKLLRSAVVAPLDTSSFGGRGGSAQDWLLLALAFVLAALPFIARWMGSPRVPLPAMNARPCGNRAGSSVSMYRERCKRVRSMIREIDDLGHSVSTSAHRLSGNLFVSSSYRSAFLAQQLVESGGKRARFAGSRRDVTILSLTMTSRATPVISEYARSR